MVTAMNRPDTPESALPLLRIKAIFGLSDAELGSIFGVSRQSVAGWLRHGLPTSRAVTAANVDAIAHILQHRLRPGLVPGIVRRTGASAYGGRSMLQVLADGEDQWLLDDIEASFDFARVP